MNHDDAASLVSIVIPCRNGAATLGAQLDALLAQESCRPFEVVVVNDGSTDGTAELIERYASHDARVRGIDVVGRGGINAARNQGVQAASGHYLLLCDSDDVVHPGWLEAYRLAFDGGADAVVGGLDFTLRDGTLIVRHRSLFTLDRMSGDVTWGYGANCGFTRSTFEAVQGFDEEFTLGGNDDIDFFIRLSVAGIVPVSVPDAVITYHLRDGLRSVYRQHYNQGRSDVQFFEKWRAFGAIRPVLWSHPGSLRLALRHGLFDVRRRRDLVRIVAVHHGRIREACARRVVCA